MTTKSTSQIDEIGVMARVAPEDKVRLVEVLKRNGNIVAMTGDGVNDAPAMKRADIGVAMGITGTEVTKEAADMILTDDNFATIVSAVDGGRALYDNLMKYVRFQIAALIGFIALFVLAGVFNVAGGIPLTPLQILWINFAIEVLLAIGLGFDSPTPGMMERKPRPANAPIVAGSARHPARLGRILTAAIHADRRQRTERSLRITNSADHGARTLSLMNVIMAVITRDPEHSTISLGPHSQIADSICCSSPVVGLTLLVTQSTSCSESSVRPR